MVQPQDIDSHLLQPMSYLSYTILFIVLTLKSPLKAVEHTGKTSYSTMKKALFLVNVDWFFLSHRLPIAQKALEQGYQVHIATKITTKQAELEANGFIIHPLPLARGKSSLLNEVHSFFAILKVFTSVKPAIIHLVTIKPVLYGGIAARLSGTNNIVAAISGLGYIFTTTGKMAYVKRWLVSSIYRLALRHDNIKVIFQNHDDQAVLSKATGLTQQQTLIIPGSGVNLDKFTYTQEIESTPIVIMVSRLLSDKGVHEFVDAAREIRQRGIQAKFQLVGEPDPDNPASISDSDMEHWHQQQNVEILGQRNDIAALFSQAHLVVLPSYREGFPKVLIEAAACGRAIVTTDVPGCRDAIIPEMTGCLVPPKDASALANAIERLILDPNLRRRMGKAGRELAEKKYAIEHVVETHLNLYQELLDKA